jgi:hypothetical protein
LERGGCDSFLNLLFSYTWYFCTWWKGIYRPGTLYLTDNLICFHSKLSEQFAIPFRDVSALDCTTSLGVVDGIKITTRSGKEYHFANFGDRDASYATLEQLWDLSMDKILKSSRKGMDCFVRNADLSLSVYLTCSCSRTFPSCGQ